MLTAIGRRVLLALATAASVALLATLPARLVTSAQAQVSGTQPHLRVQNRQRLPQPKPRQAAKPAAVKPVPAPKTPAPAPVVAPKVEPPRPPVVPAVAAPRQNEPPPQAKPPRPLAPQTPPPPPPGQAK